MQVWKGSIKESVCTHVHNNVPPWVDSWFKTETETHSCCELLITKPLVRSHGLTAAGYVRIFAVMLTCVVQMPRICCGRHWWDGERWRPTVGLHQFALVRHRRGGCRLPVWLSGCRRGLRLCGGSQCGLEGGDSVELHPRQTPDEARGVVTLDEDRVYVSSFCTETQRSF